MWISLKSCVTGRLPDFKQMVVRVCILRVMLKLRVTSRLGRSLSDPLPVLRVLYLPGPCRWTSLRTAKSTPAMVRILMLRYSALSEPV